jgi:hypothetical protein
VNERNFKRSLDRLVPYPCTWEAWKKVQERVEKRRKRRRLAKAGLAPMLLLLVLLALGRYGIWAPQADNPLVVISDQVSTSAGDAPGESPDSSAATVPVEIAGDADAAPYLAELAAAWQEKGVPVVAVQATGE